MTRMIGRTITYFVGFLLCNNHSATALATDSTPSSSNKPTSVAVVGGGISGLVVGHVLSQSPNNFDVHLFEKEKILGGNVKSVPDPLSSSSVDTSGDANEQRNMLNIGHASHMGMFWNLRLMLEYLKVEEWPVGRGKNNVPGLFRMLSINYEGHIVQPPKQDVLSPFVWLEAFRFYIYSYLQPEMRLDEFLQSQSFSGKFLSILYWSMATFEFDKTIDEAGEYALGAARALLITQLFFKFLLCDEFDGVLPSKIDAGLKDELVDRIKRNVPCEMAAKLLNRIEAAGGKDDLFNAPLASYFSADYVGAMNKLADGINGSVNTNCAVSKVMKQNDSDCLLVCTDDGKSFEVDSVVFTTQPSIISDVLSDKDFPEHLEALNAIESGAVGVQICHEKDLPFSYPPAPSNPIRGLDVVEPPSIFGVFDISQLTTTHEASGGRQKGARHYIDSNTEDQLAGWLSIAYPVYRDESLNRHEQFLANTGCVDKTIYPWIRATSRYPAIRRRLKNLQGLNGIYIAGHVLTGVNKASELQVINALKLCEEHFGALPPWGEYIDIPLLPDCNDEDAFKKAGSVFEAIGLAWKSLIGSFLLFGVVSRIGVDKFE